MESVQKASKRGNIYNEAPKSSDIELFPMIKEFDCKKAKLEHIVSYSHPTPDGEWYDQETTEYCLLVRGGAVLEFKDEMDFDMEAGSYCFIPPHNQHRVKQVSDDAVWMAVHLF